MTQEEIKGHIRTLFDEEVLVSLATADTNSQPWACVVEFAFDEAFNIYWLSSPDSRHSRNITTNNKVAATVTSLLDRQGKAVGVQMEGIASLAPEPNFARALLENKRKEKLPADLVEHRQFYILKPTLIYLLHERLLGFERVAYDF